MADNSPQVKRLSTYQEMANDTAQIKQLRSYQALADNYASMSASGVIQRMIGNGGYLHRGRIVIGPSGARFEIVDNDIFRGRLAYKLEDRDGNQVWADFQDNNYNFDPSYTGVLGFTGWDEKNVEEGEATRKRKRKNEGSATKKRKTIVPIKFHVARRHNSARTYTTFDDPGEAIRVLREECGLTAELATSIISKKDWSYPTMQSLMSLLQKEGALQPGLEEGAKLWQAEQPAKQYTIKTTSNGSPLAQIVGCHLMEYQETNNGTQGPRQSRDESRKKQLEFTQAILGLPAEQAPLHSLGIGQPDHVKLFPALFDVKFEDNQNKLFSKTAGSLTFKLYQSALSGRDQQFSHKDTLLSAARKDRKEKTKQVLREMQFDADALHRFSEKDEDHLRVHLGVKDTGSDNSMEEDESWKFPFSVAEVGEWTLREFYDYVFKHNVYSGGMFKEYAAKMAELDILEGESKDSDAQQQIEKSRARRKGVQSRVKSANDELFRIMRVLQIDIVKAYQRLHQWEEKLSILQSGNPEDEQKKTTIAAYKASLGDYMKMTLTELKKKRYPTPLQGIGDKQLKELTGTQPTEAPPAKNDGEENIS
ncbi:hypothetical protein [Chitinophaga japonensis]|nr:hypothetical protein [Chitinophaga japonensis]